MIKKRKKKKPKKRTRPGAASAGAGDSSLGLDGAASSSTDDDESPPGGLAARGLLLDALRDDTPRPPSLDDDDDSALSDPDEDGEAPDSSADDDDGAPRKLPAKPVAIPLMGAEPEALPKGLAEDEGPESGEADEDDEEDEGAAAQMGSARYVIFGFFALWLVSAYVAGQALMTLWGWFAHRDWFSQAVPTIAAIPHEGELVSRTTVSLVVGALIAGGVVIRYYTRQDIRQWADEVAEQLSKVKWPTRKEVGQNTVVVIAVAMVLTTILTLLDRFWGFVTNLIYSSGL